MMRIAARTMRQLPAPFGARARGLVAMVNRMPTREEATSLGSRRRSALLGMYRPGVGGAPDAVVVFRRPIMRIARTRRRLRAHVTDTVLHEVGHALGLDEGAVAHL